jgi:transposase
MPWAAGHDAAVQMTSVVRVHQHGACIADNNRQDMGRSRGGLTSKIHAGVDSNGLPVQLALTPGEVHDNRLCSVLLGALLPKTMLLADCGYDADWIRELARRQGACANIPPKRNGMDTLHAFDRRGSNRKAAGRISTGRSYPVWGAGGDTGCR